jgi:murein DD-endopeptidase MepM/ murein hydrolase activator NlpD
MHRRARLFVVITAVLATAFGVGTYGARAQIDIIPTSSTTTTAPPQSTTTTQPPIFGTTTTTAPPTTEPPPPSTDPTAPPATPPGGPTPTDPTRPDGPIDGGGDDGHDHGGEVVIPSQYQAVVSQYKRSSANSSQKLLDSLAVLQDYGVGANDAIAMSFGRFPVAGHATFVDDWWYPRSSPPFHLHQGTDIFAASGTPVRSPADGILTRTNGGLGGLSAKVTEPDGTYYYLAHLSAFVPEQVEGQPVKVGDIVGYVGDTGNAAGGAPHLHFEIHMAPAKNLFLYPPAPPAPKPVKGKKAPKPTPPKPVVLGNIADPVLYGRGTVPAMNPKPFLDQWLNEAHANVPALISRLEAGRPRAIVATGMLRRFTDGGGLFSAPATPPRTQLLWASSASPQGGPLRLAQTEVSAAAGELDWALLARRQEARLSAARETDRWHQAMLDPLTPKALRPLS